MKKMVVASKTNGTEPVTLHATFMVYSCQGKVAGFLFATCSDIGGNKSLDGIGTILNLAKINIIPFMCSSCSLSLHSLYI